jgi:hypothetical protein
LGHFYLRKTKQTNLIICTSKVRLDIVVCLTESILRRLAFTHHALLQSRYYMPYGLQVYKRVALVRFPCEQLCSVNGTETPQNRWLVEKT